MAIWRHIRFWVSLWGGKFFLFIYKHIGQTRNDKPGMAAVKLYGDFLRYVAKPKLVIVVTGTNGKTTLSCVIANALRAQGMRVAYNDWGANCLAGQARCMLDAVSIFNRPTKDAVVIEADELISPQTVPPVRPDYIIVSNISRDSILRNAYPEHIAQQIDRAIALCPDATVILNADDPISAFLGANNRRVYFGICDQQVITPPSVIDDFGVCPVCGGKPVYAYRNMRHVGRFSCPSCGLCSPDADYFAEKVDYAARTLTVREPAGTEEYPLFSDSLHNAYNEMAIVALMRTAGILPDALRASLAEAKVPQTRECRDAAGDIQLVSYVAKTQNPTATSIVFQYVAEDPAVKEIVWLPDEVFDSPLKSESVSWVYETDCELLARDNIKKIVVGGERYLDHRLRLLLAGVPEEKIICVQKMLDTAEYIDTSGIEKVYILHDVNYITPGHRVMARIKERILAQEAEAHEN